MKDISGKVAFITGAAGGIGLGIAKTLAEYGVRLVLTDIDRDELERVATQLNTKTLLLTLDVTDRDSWNAARTAAEQHFGAVDILCNNAGIPPSQFELADLPPQNFERTLAINLMGVFNGVHCFASSMRERRSGHIINTASTGGLTPMPARGDYAISKAAVVALSETLRLEMAPHDVGVSVLCPGLVASRMVSPDAPQLQGINLMDPIWVGRAVAKAIIENHLYIMTHPSYLPIVKARHQGIESAFGESAQPDYEMLPLRNPFKR
ncbi:MAG TPA: SDR family oxidoreductase [Spongiibacteraceae bacterium]|nr:SDR family oxidoreductase [Spongiibacteraceae bacterium]